MNNKLIENSVADPTLEREMGCPEKIAESVSSRMSLGRTSALTMIPPLVGLALP